MLPGSPIAYEATAHALQVDLLARFALDEPVVGRMTASAIGLSVASSLFHFTNGKRLNSQRRSNPTGKTRFDVGSCDAAGQLIQRVKFSRDTLIAFLRPRQKL